MIWLFRELFPFWKLQTNLICLFIRIQVLGVLLITQVFAWCILCIDPILPLHGIAFKDLMNRTSKSLIQKLFKPQLISFLSVGEKVYICKDMLNPGIPEFWMFHCPVMIFFKGEFFHNLLLKPSKSKGKTIANASNKTQRDLKISTLTWFWRKELKQTVFQQASKDF